MLKYIGNGKQHIAGIPARDLEDNELEALAASFYLDVADFIKQLTEGTRAIYKAPAPPKKTTKKDNEDDVL